MGEPALPPMQQRYAEARKEGKHIAQYQPYEGVPANLRSVMSQLPEVPVGAAKGSMKLSELRSKLQELGKSTLGTKAELEVAFEKAMREQRMMTMSWDSVTESWVPSSGTA